MKIFYMQVGLYYLRGQDGWRHLVAKVGLRWLGLGASSPLCYAAATQHWVYILWERQKKKKRNPQCYMKLLKHVSHITIK